MRFFLRELRLRLTIELYGFFSLAACDALIVDGWTQDWYACGLVVIVVYCLTASAPQVWDSERPKLEYTIGRLRTWTSYARTAAFGRRRDARRGARGQRRGPAGLNVPRRVVVAEERVMVVRGLWRRLDLIGIIGVVEAQNYNRRAEGAQQAADDLARLLEPGLRGFLLRFGGRLFRRLRIALLRRRVNVFRLRLHVVAPPPLHASVRRLDGVDRVLLLRRHGAGERLGGRDAGRAGSDEQEYRAGEPHNPLITETAFFASHRAEPPTKNCRR